MSQPNHITTLLDRLFQGVDGELRIGGVPIRRIAEMHGTPLYVYDRAILERQYHALRTALPQPFELFYSIKANPNQTFLRFFLERGCGLEIASAGELRQAVAAGCDPAHIIYAGPGKSEAELSLAVSSGVGEIHVESLHEARRIAEVATGSKRSPDLALRINPTPDAQGGAMRMGGKPSPFGIDQHQIDDVLAAMQHEKLPPVSGIHLYSGTQILDHDVLIAQYHKAVEIARHVAARTGRPLKTIDFGGGLGIPYFPNERPLDLEAFAEKLPPLVAEIQQDPLLAEARLIVEPGRFLVGECGVYVTGVIDVKTSQGKKFVVVDGGMHHHLAASGNLGQTIKRNYPVALLNKLAAGDDEEVDVVGPLCTPLDVLARQARLPSAEIGDLFGVFQSGAYARTASPLNFLSHPAPPEVWVAGGRVHQIRRRGKIDDFLADQQPCSGDIKSPPPVTTVGTLSEMMEPSG